MVIRPNNWEEELFKWQRPIDRQYRKNPEMIPENERRKPEVLKNGAIAYALIKQ